MNQANVLTFTKNGLKPAVKTDLDLYQIIWLNGYGQSKSWHEKQVIYDIQDDLYCIVNLDNFTLRKMNKWHVKPESEIFGIGMYYTPGDFADSETVKSAVQKAIENEKIRKESETKKQNERNQIIEKGKAIFSSLDSSKFKGAIWARYEIDDCDGMTDYYGVKTGEKHLLAFSEHDRDIFSEFRKAAGLFEKTKDLEIQNKENEHREKYSGGFGYYLKNGNKYDTGWSVYKTSLNSYIEEIYIAFGSGNHSIEIQQDKKDEPKQEKARCEITEYKGHKIFNIPMSDGKSFSFGTTKANLILEYFEEIKKFVETENK